jgi:hypothetical protein
MEELVFQGRKYGLRFACTTQRVNALPDAIRTEATRLVLYHTTRSWDRKVISDWVNEEVAEGVRTLDVGECYLVEF